MSRKIHLSPSAAAMLFGISERSIRRAIKSKELPFVVVQSRYKIDFKDILEWSNKLPNRIKKREEDGLGQYVEGWKE